MVPQCVSIISPDSDVVKPTGANGALIIRAVTIRTGCFSCKNGVKLAAYGAGRKARLPMGYMATCRKNGGNAVR